MAKILVIEDEQTVRENIQERLETEGFDTIGAENGQVGVMCARDHAPDLIICDVMMPELDGYEVLSKLRQDPVTATTPFIFLTAKSDKLDLRQGMELGADDYLTKPFTKAELLGAVVARLERKAAIAQQSEQKLEALRTSLAEQSRYANTDVLASELAQLKQDQFTGRLLVKSAAEQEWTFYLYLGRILYATGGIHPVRRWHRNLATYCPQIDRNQQNLPIELSGSAWEYQLLGLWLTQQKISREQVALMIRSIVTEVLFNVLQAKQVIFQTQPEETLPRQLLLMDTEQVLTVAQQTCQTWQSSKVKDLSPNQAPLLKRPEVLQKQTSPATYQQLTALLDGQRTFQDIALQMKRQAVEVSSSLYPYIQAGVVELIDIPDLLPPIIPAAPSKPPIQTASTASTVPLIACIDDSPMVCQTMEQILTGAGYKFVAVQDPLRAITTLLSRKPDLIFLDLVMPNMNGYEICSRLRKISAFGETPIIILTGNIIDRVRAKVAGSSDHLAKPVKPEMVLSVIDKHLLKTANSDVELATG